MTWPRCAPCVLCPEPSSHARNGIRLTKAVQRQLESYRALWRWYLDHGDVDTIRVQNGRRALIDRVKEGVLLALRPPSSRRPGPHVMGTSRPVPDMTDEEVERWRAADPFVREGYGPAMARSLARIMAYAPKGSERASPPVSPGEARTP